MSFRAPRRVRSDGNEGMIRPGLPPPLPAVRINNNLLSWSSVSDPPRDGVDSFSPTLRRRRNMGELNGRAGGVFLRTTSLTCKVETQNAKNKDELPRELFRRAAYRAPCSGCEHVRPQDSNAEGIASLFCEQTPIEVLRRCTGRTRPQPAAPCELQETHVSVADAGKPSKLIALDASKASLVLRILRASVHFALTLLNVPGSLRLVRLNDSEFFILFQGFLQDF